MTSDHSMLRSLPAVDEVLRLSEVQDLLATGLPRWAIIEAVRGEIEDRRRAILGGSIDPPRPIDARIIATRSAALLRPALRGVVNVTGVVVHTNLGRAPLPRPALDRLVSVCGGYSNLEYRLVEGSRGSRHEHLRRLASSLFAAEDAVVVNNNAAAVLLTVSALAAGRDVVVSRGELVEIGGGFRIPDVIVQGGARLREVGTTNRTRLDDYASAVGPDTAALLKVHRSNFDIVGFTEEVGIEDLASLAHSRGLPLVADLGSGAMLDSYGPGLQGEPVVREAVAAGADLVCVSGDKLLGGPQAGLVLGRAELVETVRKHPLMRALRPCKLTLSALEATLELWRDGRVAEIPVVRMLRIDPEDARRRAVRFARALRRADTRWDTEVVQVSGRAGGGSMPSRTTPGWAVALGRVGVTAVMIETALREGDPPVIARIMGERVIVDLRTMRAEYDPTLVELITRAGSALVTGA